MRQTRLLLIFPLFLALVAALAACGGDEAPSDEEYFRNMDEADKEVDQRFNTLCESEDITGKECATEFADAAAFAETEYSDISPAEDAKDEHEELVASIKEFRANLESARDDLSDDDPVDAFLQSGATDATRANNAFCAIQALADEKKIEADVGCGGGEEAVDPSTLPAEETTEVLIQDFVFDPPHIQVTVGDTVTWTQGTDEEPHTATADDDSFDTGVLTDEGETGEFTFEEAGEFSYFCEIHPEMLGLVNVVE
jgi:plastocyanin